MVATLSPSRPAYAFSPPALPQLPLLEVAGAIEAARQPFSMVVRGLISHGLLVNYRISPHAIEGFDLGPLEWDTHKGAAYLSVCLLKYKHLGPAWLPRPLQRLGPHEVLYRLAVRSRHGDRDLRGFLSLLNQSSSRLLVAAGRRMGWHKFTRAQVRLDVRDDVLSVDAPGIHFVTSLSSRHFAAPATSLFENLHEAESYLLNPAADISVGPDGTTRLQPVSRSRWKAAFLEPSEAYFELLEPWAGGGLLEYDSVLYLRNLRQAWAPPRNIHP